MIINTYDNNYYNNPGIIRSLLNIIHLSNFLTTRPSLNNLTTFRALNKEPIPYKNNSKTPHKVFSAQTYVLVVVEGIEDIVGETREKVDDEPRLEIVDPDDGWVADHLPAGPHVGGVEVEDDIDEENHIHYRVHHQQTHVLGGLVF